MLKIVTRKDWHAKPPKETSPLLFPVRSVVFRYTETEKCNSEYECCKVLRGLQQAALSKGLPDIPYNFLVGGDLSIYEGRGWESIVFNRKLVIAYIAYNADKDYLMDQMTNVAYDFVKKNDNKIKVLVRPDQLSDQLPDQSDELPDQSDELPDQ